MKNLLIALLLCGAPALIGAERRPKPVSDKKIVQENYRLVTEVELAEFHNLIRDNNTAKLKEQLEQMPAKKKQQMLRHRAKNRLNAFLQALAHKPEPNLEILKLFIQHGADINQPINCHLSRFKIGQGFFKVGWTAAHIVCHLYAVHKSSYGDRSSTYEAAIALLKESKCDFEIKVRGQTPQDVYEETLERWSSPPFNPSLAAPNQGSKLTIPLYYPPIPSNSAFHLHLIQCNNPNCDPASHFPVMQISILPPPCSSPLHQQDFLPTDRDPESNSSSENEVPDLDPSDTKKENSSNDDDE